MKALRVLCAMLLLAAFMSVPAGAQYSPEARYGFHYQTLLNAEALPPFGVQFGDLYLNIASDGTVSGYYQIYDGISSYGAPYPVYGARRGNSISLQIDLNPRMQISGFVDGDRVEGTASNGRMLVGFRALLVT